MNSMMTKLLNNFLRTLVVAVHHHRRAHFLLLLPCCGLLVCDTAKLAESAHSTRRAASKILRQYVILYYHQQQSGERMQTQMAHTKRHAKPTPRFPEAELFCFTRGFRNNNFLSSFRRCQHVQHCIKYSNLSLQRDFHTLFESVSNGIIVAISVENGS